ncbi:phage portal protein, PBSX family, partial [Escherichia coli PA3]
MSRKNKKVRM